MTELTTTLKTQKLQSSVDDLSKINKQLNRDREVDKAYFEKSEATQMKKVSLLILTIQYRFFTHSHAVLQPQLDKATSDVKAMKKVRMGEWFHYSQSHCSPPSIVADPN